MALAGSMATARLVPHSHCKLCEEPITEGEEYCSEKCKTEYESKTKKSNLKENLFIVAAAIVVIVIGIIFYF